MKSNSVGSFRRNVHWQLIANILQMGLGGAYLIALGRLLGPDQFGKFSIACAVVLVFGQVAEFRIQDVIAKKLCGMNNKGGLSTEEYHNIKDLFLFECMSRAFPMLVLLAFVYPLGSILDLGQDGLEMLCIAGVGWIIGKSGSTLSTGILRVAGRTDYFALCIGSDFGLRLVLILIAAYLGILTATSAMTIITVVGMVGNILLITCACGIIKPNWPHSNKASYQLRGFWVRMRSDRRFLGANVALSLSDLMSKDLDIVLMSGAMSAAQIGVYKMAKSIVYMIWRMIDPFYLAIMPEIQRLFQEKHNVQLEILIGKTSRYLLALSIFLVFCSYVGLSLLHEWLLGPEYSMVGSLVLLMSSWVIFCAPLIWGHPLAVAVNKPGLASWATLVGTFFGTLLLVALIKPFGLVGAGIAWSVSSMIVFYVTAQLSWKSYIKERQRSGSVMRPVEVVR